MLDLRLIRREPEAVRTALALLENGQRDDGAVALPDVLDPYGAPAELPPAGIA